MAVLGRSQPWVKQPHAFGVQPGVLHGPASVLARTIFLPGHVYRAPARGVQPAVLQRPFRVLARTVFLPGRAYRAPARGVPLGVLQRPFRFLTRTTPTRGRVWVEQPHGIQPPPPNARAFIARAHITPTPGRVRSFPALGVQLGVLQRPFRVLARIIPTPGRVRQARALGAQPSFSAPPMRPILLLSHIIPTPGRVRRASRLGVVPGVFGGVFTILRQSNAYRAPPPTHVYRVTPGGTLAGISHAATTVTVAHSYRSPTPGKVRIFPAGGVPVVPPEIVGNVNSFGRTRVVRVVGKDQIR